MEKLFASCACCYCAWFGLEKYTFFDINMGQERAWVGREGVDRSRRHGLGFNLQASTILRFIVIKIVQVEDK
jgi:hypothetical protein